MRIVFEFLQYFCYFCSLLFFVAAVDGDFDYCQLAVKHLLADDEFHRELEEKYNIGLRQVIADL